MSESKKTFVDAGVLIAAARGKDEISAQALKILDDPDREFVSGPFLKLEILPKPIYEKRQAEVEFYEAFFNAVTHWADSVQDITNLIPKMFMGGFPWRNLPQGKCFQ